MGDDPNLMPARFFRDDMSAAERKETVMKAYERLKVSLDKFLKPDGSKEAPAKTCGDIKHHHPELESGKCTHIPVYTVTL
jgi:collagen type II alpha